MSAQPDATGTIGPTSPAVDDRHPWLGLASFTEETRDYFYGREEEVAELARRVQRKLLTVLFGQSGLGKTSILRAGLVPRLRGHGYCPVYVRIAYSADAPEPGEQIKRAIQQTARRSGQWTQVGVAAAGETLWEFLHHRDDVLQDESGNNLIPLLIFDQFEEIFTLAQTDEAGRARAARFIADLADLVENRAPQALEAKLEADDSTAERFDFARGDYRVLIALREDYLAPLESLKGKMPSVTQNRLRLAPMTGKQGLEAVMRPGKSLVSEEVAAAIVRFVAGGAEIANAEVEPSLLSLICRELNDTRIAQGRSEISLDLLAGSHATILSNFYERALADQPADVRRIIEDELLTDSGFRENIAEERLRARFSAAGAAPETLAVLVNRRLLRIEERLDVRRVELTHDVLCGVVKSSRDLRHEREAREATEKMLAEQRERELAARHALVRARKVATVCIVLAIGAIAAAIFAYWSTQRAKHAEQIAQQSRVQAELLLSYLTEGFARELDSSGRLDVIASLAKREIDYFHGLPPELKGLQTQRTGAQAMVQFAKASRRLGNLDEGSAAADEAITLLERLARNGDASEATTVALVRAIEIKARILSTKQDPAAIPTLKRAIDVLRPLSSRPDASKVVREVEMELLNALGVEQVQVVDPKAIDSLERSMQLGKQLGAVELKDAYIAGLYTEGGAWLMPALLSEKRYDDARRVGDETAAVAEKLLKQRPADRWALYSLSLIRSSMADTAALIELRPLEAIPIYERARQVQQTMVDFDPGNTISQNNLGSILWSTAEAYWLAGQPRESERMLQTSLGPMEIAGKGGGSLMLTQLRIMSYLAMRETDLGEMAKAKQLGDEIAKYAGVLHKRESRNRALPVFADLLKLRVDSLVAFRNADPRSAGQICAAMLSRVGAADMKSGADEMGKNQIIHLANDLKAQSELMLGDFQAAEQSARASLAAKKLSPFDPSVDVRQEGSASTLIALALVNQKRNDEAQQVIEPVVRLHRELASRNHSDQLQRVEMANALYVQGLADPQHRAALLREAKSLIDSIPLEMKTLFSVRALRDRIQEAMG